MRKFNTTTLFLVLFGASLQPLTAMANTALPVQVIETQQPGQSLPAIENLRAAIVNEMHEIKQLSEELALAHATLKTEYEQTITSCDNDKCKVLELQRVAQELAVVEAGFSRLKTKAMTLLQGDMEKLPGVLVGERAAIVRRVKEGIIVEANEMRTIYMDATGGQANVDVSTLPLESKMGLDALSIRLDDLIEALQFSVLDLEMVDYHLSTLSSSKQAMEVDVQVLARNASSVTRERTSMQRTADSYIRYGILSNTALTAISGQPLEGFPRLTLPDVSKLANSAPVEIVLPPVMDIGGKLEVLSELSERIDSLDR
ncbi:hypothetical protein DDN80_16070 [Vibrio cholerae]|nr:hypothetical protein [Vibrio cholerae]EKF9234447.1 hypothetical protein [Vibrio cholerae]HAV6897887.1 hypothetical protein [Vibrio vulnificus]HCJ6893382.1 hypothetical protein [Vibrio cholerae]HDY7436657.1 hypothetical protein [Vibrio vulnificus]